MQDVFWGNRETNAKLCSGNLVLVVIAMCSNAILSVFLPFFSSHPSAEVAPLAHMLVTSKHSLQMEAVWQRAALPPWGVCSVFPGSVLQLGHCCPTEILHQRRSSSCQHLLGGFPHRMFVQIMDKCSSVRNMGFMSVENQVLSLTFPLLSWCWMEAVRAIRAICWAYQEGSASGFCDGHFPVPHSPDPIFAFLSGIFSLTALMGNLPLKEKGRETSWKSVSSISSLWYL